MKMTASSRGTRAAALLISESFLFFSWDWFGGMRLMLIGFRSIITESTNLLPMHQQYLKDLNEEGICSGIQRPRLRREYPTHHRPKSCQHPSCHYLPNTINTLHNENRHPALPPPSPHTNPLPLRKSLLLLPETAK